MLHFYKQLDENLVICYYIFILALLQTGGEMRYKNDQEGQDLLLVGLKISWNWILKKINLINRLKHGAKIIITIGILVFFLNLVFDSADKFWKWALGLWEADHLVFRGSGILAMALLAYLIAVVTDIFKSLLIFVGKRTPRAIKESRLITKITDNDILFMTLKFFIRDTEPQEEASEKLERLMKMQPAIVSLYSPWGIEELGFIAGQVTFGNNKSKRWKVVVPSPPVIISGGKIGFVKDHNIIFLLKIPLPEIVNFYASFGIVSRRHFEELDKALYGISVEINPENLPKVEEICDIQSLKMLYGIKES